MPETCRQLARPTASPVENGDLLRVVYVVGSSHSGSTLLSLLADEHPGLATVGETAVKRRTRVDGPSLGYTCSCGSTLDACTFWQRVFAAIAADSNGNAPEHWSHDYRFEHPWLHNLFTRDTSVRVIRQLRRVVARAGPYRSRLERVHEANVRFIRAVLAQNHATVFLDATKVLLRLTYLMEIPNLDVRVVHLVRDVRGFAMSAKRRGASPVAAARVWRNDQAAILHMLSKVTPERALLTRYEDLCTHTAVTLRRLWEFSGLDSIGSPHVVRTADHHVIGNSMRLEANAAIRLDDRWRTDLAADEQRKILRIAGSLNRQFGYE